MKRYFISLARPLWTPSAFHYLDLPNGAGHVVMMEESEHPPHVDWQELPHLLDTTTRMKPEHAAKLVGFAGIAADDSMYAIAIKLAAVHSHFHP